MSKSVKFTSGQFFVAVHRLARWFEHQRRILPWRNDPSVYRVWVSEIMLQQTQVVTVVPYFERFMTHYPTLDALTAASEADVLKLWAGLGYYSRARNLYRAAKIFVENGFPKSRAEWLEVPGIGDYTAGAILSIALDQPEPILDGNVERVISRVRRTSDRARLRRLSRAFVETSFRRGIRPSVANQALMELGATVCSPRQPHCGKCPLFDICHACAAGDAEQFPESKKRKEWIAIQEELHCIFGEDGRVLLREREPGEWRAGLWDLIEPRALDKSRSAKTALTPMGTVQTRHIVTRHKILRTTHVWKAEKKGIHLRVKSSRWVSIHTPEVAVGAALQRTLNRIREKFPEVSRLN